MSNSPLAGTRSSPLCSCSTEPEWWRTGSCTGPASEWSSPGTTAGSAAVTALADATHSTQTKSNQWTFYIFYNSIELCHLNMMLTSHLFSSCFWLSTFMLLISSLGKNRSSPTSFLMEKSQTTTIKQAHLFKSIQSQNNHEPSWFDTISWSWMSDSIWRFSL